MHKSLIISISSTIVHTRYDNSTYQVLSMIYMMHVFTHKEYQRVVMLRRVMLGDYLPSEVLYEGEWYFEVG